ncbi:putative acetyl-CoA carboxylase biotin carboxyl carrier protein subunit [Thermococcus sp. 4557]|uniref:acetyl-CoA carboxylase biotin carboxyl carrier protein subunit n=1 Tax=Thermococcus sp. (strain CGMCC 1.5172 / 4557) TaxID=1042877 RepID=UPI000219ECE7|nr:acetyl-CoA carboxylase biotin carboxyl carrier protein subunit [Thermococcus sp. 4557]AEK72913.1 putative acetyl-CoA carboxylase biotin carboxyl carrier protein subunit [Thermococcus sp. 4557]
MAKVKVIVDGVEYEVEVEELGGGRFKVAFEDKEYTVEAKGLGIDVGALSTVPTSSAPSAPSTPAPAAAPALAPVAPAAPAPAPAGEGVVTAPMPGKILRILVKEGEQVKTGQGLLVLEAMKMENEIPAPKDGVVKKILIKEGDTVDTGQALIELG